MTMPPLGRTLQSMLVDDAPTMPQAPQAAKNRPNWAGIIADVLAGAMGREGPYAAMMQQQRAAEQQDARWTRRQSSELDQYRQKLEIERDPRYAKPTTPYRTQDNAGNVWEQQPDGQFKRIFTDMAPKQMVVDGMLVTTPNPYANPTPQAPTAAPPPVIDEDLWNTGKPVGGPTPQASGSFRR